MRRKLHPIPDCSPHYLKIPGLLELTNEANDHSIQPITQRNFSKKYEFINAGLF